MRLQLLTFMTSAIFFVSCQVHVADIYLNYSQISLHKNDSFTLAATIIPQNAKNHIIDWSSTNSNIVAITATGTHCFIKALSEGSATIVAHSSDGGHIAKCDVNVIPHYIFVAGQKGVDLGLSVIWAFQNIGANAPEEPGDFFAWAETKPKKDYKRLSYKYYSTNMNFTKYCQEDSKYDLDLIDDAVNQYYGKGWRTPTYHEWEELHYYCTWKPSRINNMTGFLITGKTGNQMFLPVAGMYIGKEYNPDTSYYWSSTLYGVAKDGYSPYEAIYAWWMHNYDGLLINKGNFFSRTCGMPIRGVIEY